MRRYELNVKGLVQGVGYRASVHKKISLLCVTGFIRNKEDRTVEIVVECYPAAIDEVVKIARAGSHYSAVDEVTLEEKRATGEFSSFDIVI